MKFSDHKQTAKEYKIGGSDFWKTEQGDNRVRILSGYEVYGFHWIKERKEGGICIGKDDGCKWCAMGDKPKAKFLLWILDRKDGEVKIGQVGYTVIQQIGELQQSPDWDFTEAPDYDVNIKRSGKDLDTKYYVQPSPNKSPLTGEEEAKKRENMKDLKEIIGRMKTKAGGSADVINYDEEVPPQDEEFNPAAPDADINVENIPF